MCHQSNAWPRCSGLRVRATIISSSSRAGPFSFCWEEGGGTFRMHRHRGERPESFIIVKEQTCSRCASRQFHHRPPEEEKRGDWESERTEAMGEKVIGVGGGGCRPTSVASQARPQMSRARGSAEWELTAGAVRSMPPGD